MDSDRFDLQRFTNAQAGVIEAVRAELAEGRKASHWMWFVFPQIAGLGSSPMSRRYAITSRAEAAAFLADPVLGSRLAECAGLAERWGREGRSAEAVFGPVDAMKFRSSMTLFAEVAGRKSVFGRNLDLFFAGEADPATLSRLEALGPLVS
ncbi:MAG: DUF1810 domain-containing protein [Caulobacteraceae bacterium]